MSEDIAITCIGKIYDLVLVGARYASLAFCFCFCFFFFFKKITRYASLPLVGPFIFVFFLQENNKIRLTATGGAFFSFFLQKNPNVRSNHHKLFYRWIWDKFFFFIFFYVRYGINFYLCLSSFFFLLRKVCFYLNLLLIYQLPTISDVCKIIYDF